MEDIGLADKVDKLLRDYFDGTMDKQIKAREMYLHFHNDVDENVGVDEHSISLIMLLKVR